MSPTGYDLQKVQQKRERLYGKQVKAHVEAKNIKALENLKDMMIIDWERGSSIFRTSDFFLYPLRF